MSESVVLCEGYYDRAFWAGWLTHLDCKDLGEKKPVLDPRGLRVSAGQYAFHSISSRFIRVVPCHGKGNILPEAHRRLKARETDRLVRLVINSDSDLQSGDVAQMSPAISAQAVQNLVLSVDPNATKSDDDGFLLDGGAVSVYLVFWKASDQPRTGLPSQQTLERLICASLIAAYPDRAPAVQEWLDSRPSPPNADPKEHAWSYMAGWYAKHGCEDFCRHVWRDPNVARELEARLRASGAWVVAEKLAT